ncbi:hypothetical protein PM082_001502 [Marasmius tenuissimus]|nr:hypothetical protein PM082_001502 [Marasmius tenuissimus]
MPSALFVTPQKTTIRLGQQRQNAPQLDLEASTLHHPPYCSSHKGHRAKKTAKRLLEASSSPVMPTAVHVTQMTQRQSSPIFHKTHALRASQGCEPLI